MCENCPGKRILEVFEEVGGEGRAPGPGDECPMVREAAGESAAVGTGRSVDFLRGARVIPR